MGWWKRHTNSCAKWENILKHAQESIAKHDKKRGLSETTIRRLEAGADHNIKRRIRLAEMVYYENLQERVDYALGMGKLMHTGREMMELYIDDETGCLKEFEDTIECHEAQAELEDWHGEIDWTDKSKFL